MSISNCFWLLCMQFSDSGKEKEESSEASCEGKPYFYRLKCYLYSLNGVSIVYEWIKWTRFADYVEIARGNSIMLSALEKDWISKEYITVEALEAHMKITHKISPEYRPKLIIYSFFRDINLPIIFSPSMLLSPELKLVLLSICWLFLEFIT